MALALLELLLEGTTAAGVRRGVDAADVVDDMVVPVEDGVGSRA